MDLTLTLAGMTPINVNAATRHPSLRCVIHQMDATYMTMQTRSAFLQVRALADLEQVAQQLTAYLEILRRHTTAPEQVLLGIWIGEEDAVHPISTLTFTDARGVTRVMRIPEATGINGIWMLCWLESAEEGAVSRAELVASLCDCFGHDPNDQSTPRFIPVYASEIPGCSIRAELVALQVLYPGLLFPPIQLNRDGGLSYQQCNSSAKEPPLDCI